MQPYSFLLGHSPIVARAMGKWSKNAHAVYLAGEIRQMYPELGPNYYLDLMPFAPSMSVIGTPEAHYQIAPEHHQYKLPNSRNFVKLLTDGHDMLTMEGVEWKKWRAIFNPGCSPARTTKLVPTIVKETETSCNNLDKHVQKQYYLTQDIIGQTVLGVHLDRQGQPKVVKGHHSHSNSPVLSN